MSGACSGRRTVLPYSSAIDEYSFDSCGVLGRVLEVGEVDHRLRIKHHQVGEVALPDLSAPGKSEYQGWTAGHPVHGILEPQQSQVSAIVTEDPGECAPEPGMGMDIVR